MAKLDGSRHAVGTVGGRDGSGSRCGGEEAMHQWSPFSCSAGQTVKQGSNEVCASLTVSQVHSTKQTHTRRREDRADEPQTLLDCVCAWLVVLKRTSVVHAQFPRGPRMHSHRVVLERGSVRLPSAFFTMNEGSRDKHSFIGPRQETEVLHVFNVPLALVSTKIPIWDSTVSMSCVCVCVCLLANMRESQSVCLRMLWRSPRGWLR